MTVRQKEILKNLEKVIKDVIISEGATDPDKVSLLANSYGNLINSILISEELEYPNQNPIDDDD